MRILITFILLLSSLSFSAQTRVLLDDDIAEWIAYETAYQDILGDGGFAGLDLGMLKIFNDDDHLFFLIEVGIEMNLQDNNSLTIYLDTDQDPSTGYDINGIGAELTYNFGDRSGEVFLNGNFMAISQFDIGLVSSPSVTSDVFEVAIDRDLSFFGADLFSQDPFDVFIRDNGFNGDQLPSEMGGVSYEFVSATLEPLPTYGIDRHALADLRVLSYNVLQGGLFEPSRVPAFTRILNAVDPDIIAFQEIYAQDALEVAQQVEIMLPSGTGQQWYFAKESPDVVVVSRFPILGSSGLGGLNSDDGNGVFLIDLPYPAEDLLLFNAHPPCCENDFGRQHEVDIMMAFLRDLKNGLGPFTLNENSPILICGDMNFVGDDQQLKTLLTGDIVNEGLYGIDFSPDWNGDSFVDSKPYTTSLPFSMTWYDEVSSFSPGRLDFHIFSGSVLEELNSFSLFTPSLPSDSLSNYGLLINDSKIASDHLPVVIDLKLNNPVSVQTIQEHRLDIDLKQVFNRLLLTFPYATSNVFVDIYNVQGKKMTSRKLRTDGLGAKIEIDLSKFASGVYMVSAQSKQKRIVKSFVLGDW